MQTGFSETLIGWKSGKTTMSLYGTEYRKHGYGLRLLSKAEMAERDKKQTMIDLRAISEN
jgi:hypothetical protein